MTEDEAKKIYEATDLSVYTYEELRAVDLWVRDYALNKLEQHLRATGTTSALVNYVTLMARCHFGSAETDEFLIAHRCYPSWIED